MGNTCGCYCEQTGQGRGDGLPCAVLCADVGGSGVGGRERGLGLIAQGEHGHLLAMAEQ